MESILTSIKKLLGIGEEYEAFDNDIVMYINSVFPMLAQLGIGPKEGFIITDESTTWNEYLNGNKMLETVKMYICLKVKLLFDPPASGTIVEVIKETIKELEWRINVEYETPNNSIGDNGGNNDVEL